MIAEYLDRSSLVARMKYYEEHTTEESGEHYAYSVALREIRNAPAADVAEVVHGQWCVSKIRSIETVFYCSECKRTVTVGNDFFGEAPRNVSAAYPYCHCGAKMDGASE